MTEVAWEALYDRGGLGGPVWPKWLGRPCMTEVACEALHDRGGLGGPV